MNASEFNSLCTQTIVWRKMLTRDKYGKPLTYSTAVTYRGRRVFKHRRVPGRDGAEVLSTMQIWILGVPDLSYDDLVYVAGDELTHPPTIVAWDKPPDEEGEFYVKVFFGSF